MRRTAFSPHDDLYIDHLKTTKKHNMPVQHYHDAYEIYLQLDGKRYLFLDNIYYTLGQGDLVLFKPFDIHFAESRESDYYERYVINFQAKELSILLNKEELHLLLERINSCVVHLTKEQTKVVLDYIEKIKEFQKNSGFLSKKLLYSCVLQLIMYIEQFINSKSVAIGNRVAPQIIEALVYIDKNYRNAITLEDIANASHISKYHFCRLFKETTGATVLEYLNNVRLTKVHSLLIDTNAAIGEIAKETGFMSSANLTRVFKKIYGISPRDFRKNQRNQ